MTSPRDASPIASSKPALVLASESPRRLQLLAQAGIVPNAVRAAALDESIHRKEDARAYAVRLAAEKARAVATQWNGAPAVILAADTVVVLGRRVLPKAANGDEVKGCLKMLSGRAHRVLTAVAALDAAWKLRTLMVESRLIFVQQKDTTNETKKHNNESENKTKNNAVQG